MKRPTTLLNRVLLNEALQVSLATERDQKVISDRVLDEGMSFLTITLPSLCDALDQGLARGRIAPTMFPGFKPWKRGGKLPALLSGFFMRIFDRDGVLLAKPCIDSIRAIRQITRLFKKVMLPCSPARITQAFERYETNDTEILALQHQIPTDSVFDIISGCLWADLERLCGSLYGFPGKYGSGATAEHFKRNERYNSLRWTERLERFFPSSEFLVVNPGDRETLERVTFDSPDSELPVRVVQVPKTLKSPRTISVEPSYMMLCQQSVASFLYVLLESGRLGFKSIRFTDQTINRELARRGSIDGSLATIDLKDASDYVSLHMVQRMFRTCPTFLGFILACRSTSALLPNGRRIQLNKYASMGSALCFPIEAMYFLTVTVTALVRRSGRRPSPHLVRDLCQQISIYGDDIIIPSEVAPEVITELETFGLKVNHSKSFYTGFFRESCGGDYFQGHDVTPVYVRHWDDSGNRLTSSHLASRVSLANQFYLKGLWNVSKSICEDLGRRGYIRVPRSTSELAVLSYRSVFLNTNLHWDQHRCAYRVRGYKLVPPREPDSILDSVGFARMALGSRYYSESLKSLRKAFKTTDSAECALSGIAEFSQQSPLERFIPDRTYWNGSQESPCKPDELAHFGIIPECDPLSSIKSYSLKTKNRWCPNFC